MTKFSPRMRALRTRNKIIRTPKIFCVGMNKTGTSSLHRFFRVRGLTAIHDRAWTHYSHVENGKSYLNRYQCYSDGDQPDITRLRGWYPDAIFLLNTRDEEKWLISRIKHVFKRGQPGDAELAERFNSFSGMVGTYFTDPRRAIEGWIADKRIYEARVRNMLGGSDRFAEVRVTEDPDWTGRLDDFLTSHDVRMDHRRMGLIPRENVRPEEEIEDTKALERHVAMARDILDRVRAEGELEA